MANEWRSWWEAAESELAQAKVAYENQLYQFVAFWSHQIAETGLKGLWMVRSNAPAPHTHNLTQLAEPLGAPELIISRCRFLTPLYTGTRYPDAVVGNPALGYDEHNAGLALEYAQEVIDWCSEQLPR